MQEVWKESKRKHGFSQPSNEDVTYAAQCACANPTCWENTRQHVRYINTVPSVSRSLSRQLSVDIILRNGYQDRAKIKVRI